MQATNETEIDRTMHKLNLSSRSEIHTDNHDPVLHEIENIHRDLMGNYDISRGSVADFGDAQEGPKKKESFDAVSNKTKATYSTSR